MSRTRRLIACLLILGAFWRCSLGRSQAAADTPGASYEGGQAFGRSGPASFSRKTLTLENAVDIALKKNLALSGLQARAEAMSAVPPQAGSLPDPMLSFNALNMPTDSFDLSQEAMTQMQVAVSQTFPFPGKLSLRRRAAQSAAAAAAQSVKEARLVLIRDVKSVWWELFFLDRALEILRHNQQLLRQLKDAVRSRYEVGKGLQQDVLLAQIELSNLLNEEIRLLGLRRTARAQLNALLNRPPDAGLTLPARIDQELPEIPPEEKLFRIAENQRPLLAGEKDLLEAAAARLKLAEKDRMPDFKVSAAYGVRKGSNPDGGPRSDFASVMLSMNIPLYAGKKQNKAVEQRSSELIRQRILLGDKQQKVNEEICRRHADYQSARKRAELLRTGIIPQARQTVSSMRSGYEVNKVDFLNLVRSELALYASETRYWKAVSDANKALAGLAAAVGKEISDEW